MTLRPPLRLTNERTIDQVEDEMISPAARVSKVANVVISVADVDRAIAFYAGPLGLDKRSDIPFGDQYRGSRSRRRARTP